MIYFGPTPIPPTLITPAPTGREWMDYAVSQGVALGYIPWPRRGTTAARCLCPQTMVNVKTWTHSAQIRRLVLLLPPTYHRTSSAGLASTANGGMGAASVRQFCCIGAWKPLPHSISKCEISAQNSAWSSAIGGIILGHSLAMKMNCRNSFCTKSFCINISQVQNS